MPAKAGRLPRYMLFSLACALVFGAAAYAVYAFSPEKNNRTETISRNFDTVPYVEVNAPTTELYLSVHDGNDIRLEYIGNGELSAEYDDKTEGLKITVKTDTRIALFKLRRDENRLTLSLPQDKVKKLVSVTTTGSVIAEGVERVFLDLSVTSGNIGIVNCSGNFSLYSISGGISAALSGLDGDFNATTASGGVSLELPAKSEYYLEYETNSGTISAGFLEGGSFKGSMSAGSVKSRCSVIVSAKAGNLVITETGIDSEKGAG